MLVLLLGSPAWSQDIQPVPALNGRVVDLAGLLSSAERAGLEKKLADFESQSGSQIVVLTLRSTAPEDIASYAQRVGDAWKIGRRNVGDGLLIVVAKDDRRVWIAPAKALEGKHALVLDQISRHQGQVKLDGEIWTARPYNDDDVYEAGDHVTVMHIDGATAVVWKTP